MDGTRISAFRATFSLGKKAHRSHMNPLGPLYANVSCGLSSNCHVDTRLHISTLPATHQLRLGV